MGPFEIYLLKPSADADCAEAVLDALSREQRIGITGDDPSHVHYRNPDTGVFFDMLLAPEVIAAWDARAAAARRADDDYAEPPAEEAPRREEETQSEEDDEEDATAFDVEQAPLIINMPLLVMEFFLKEALALAESVARGAGLSVDLHAGIEEQARAPSLEGIAEAWREARRQAVEDVVVKGDGVFELKVHGAQSVRVKLSGWSSAKAEAWWRYGCGRRRLADELDAHGIAVPRLRTVRHEGTIKSICEWRPGTPCVLPRTDLVLVRREKERKSLFGTRRVAEEGIVPHEQLWKILAAHSELRNEPAELLIHRKTPPDIAARLDGMALEPPDHIRNALLLGVVDCEIPRPPEA